MKAKERIENLIKNGLPVMSEDDFSSIVHDLNAVIRVIVKLNRQNADLLRACKMARRLLNANTSLDAGNPANIAIEQAIARADI